MAGRGIFPLFPLCVLVGLCAGLIACDGGLFGTDKDSGASGKDDQDSPAQGDDDERTELELDSVEPAWGDNLLSRRVTISGAGLLTATRLRLGAVLLEDWEALDDATISARVPAGMAVGWHELDVESESSQAALADVYEVRDAVVPYAYVSGVVRGRLDEALEGLEVRAVTAPVSTFTDDSGAYRLPLPPEPVDLEIENPIVGGNPACPRGTVRFPLGTESLSQDYRMDVDLDYGLVSGRVEDEEGQGVEGVEVQTFTHEWPHFFGEAMTDEAGFFQLPLYKGMYWVRVDPSSTPELAGTWEDDLLVSGDIEPTWTLEAGVPVTGLVVNRDGDPVGPLHIAPSPYSDPEILPFFVGLAEANVAGQWQTRLMPGTYAFAANAFGPQPESWNLPEFDMVDLGVEDIEGPTNLVLRFDFAYLEVQILADGVPAPFPCTVELRHPWGPTDVLNLGAVDAGRFLLPVWKESIFLVVSPPFGKGFAVTALDLGEITEDTYAELDLDQGFLQEGIITDGNGEALQNVLVTFDPFQPPPPPPPPPPDRDRKNPRSPEPPPGPDFFITYGSNYTDEDGAYALEAPAGEYRVTAWWGGEDFSGSIAQLESHQVVGDGLLDFEVAMARVQARITRGGQGLKNVFIRFSDSETFSAAQGSTDEEGALALTMPTGEYSLAIIPPDPMETRPIKAYQLLVDEDAQLAYDFPAAR